MPSCIEPDLVCAYNPAVLPPCDISTSSQERLDQRLEKFGGEAQLMALSPMQAVRPGINPILILTGEDDEITTLHDIDLFTEAMQKAGNDCRLITYPKATHGFYHFKDGNNPWFAQTTG